MGNRYFQFRCLAVLLQLLGGILSNLRRYWLKYRRDHVMAELLVAIRPNGLQPMERGSCASKQSLLGLCVFGRARCTLACVARILGCSDHQLFPHAGYVKLTFVFLRVPRFSPHHASASVTE